MGLLIFVFIDLSFDNAKKDWWIPLLVSSIFKGLKKLNMPINRNALLRYKALDECFSNRSQNFDIQELRKYIENRIREETDNNDYSISQNQIKKDIKALESGLIIQPIELKENYYDIVFGRINKFGTQSTHKYRIYKYEDPSFRLFDTNFSNNEKIALSLLLSSIMRFKANGIYSAIYDDVKSLSKKIGLNLEDKEINSFIVFDYIDKFYGTEHIPTLLNAIKEKTVIRLLYKPFTSDAYEIITHPYFLKEHNKRWYLYGIDNRYKKKFSRENFNCLPLERIISESIEPIYNIEYLEPDKNFTGEKFLEDYVGVGYPGEKTTNIKIKATGEVGFLLESNVIHKSQKTIHTFEEKGYFIFSLDLKPSKDFYSEMLSYGEGIEILSPQSVRDIFTRKLKQALKLYKSDDDTR